jgi:outer membrane immunogenic protein
MGSLHMKYKLGLGIGITTLLLSGTAFAADIPIKARPMAPYAPYYNWSGFYVGGNVGYGWASGDGTITMGPFSGPVTGSGHGIFGGAQAGYNFQTGSFVFGVEADIQLSGQKGNFSGNAGPNVFTGSSSIPWFGTVRGRLGYSFDRTLLYATAGGAFGEGKIDGTSNITGAFTDSKNFFTWTVGAGLEQAIFDRWSVKFEYLFFGKPNDVPTPPGTTAISGSLKTQLVRAGLNYRF